MEPIATKAAQAGAAQVNVWPSLPPLEILVSFLLRYHLICHKSLEMTRRYSHITQKRKKDTIRLLDEKKSGDILETKTKINVIRAIDKK